MVERWADTCALLDVHLPFPAGRTWADELAQQTKTHNSSLWASEERLVAAEGRNNSVVLTLLTADYRVYRELALPRFEAQLKSSRLLVRRR